MHLNPILFPAPRTKYTPDSLMGELIWIPKYKAGSKITTPNVSAQKPTQRITSCDFGRKHKHFLSETGISTTYNRNISLRPTTLADRRREEITGHHGHSKSAFSSNNDYHGGGGGHTTRILNPLESFEAYENVILKSNLHQKHRILDEKENTENDPNRYSMFHDDKDDTVINNLLKINHQSFLLKSPTFKKSAHGSPEVSFDVLDSPIQTGPTFLEKKFVKDQQLSNKVSKASIATRDDCSNFDSYQSSTNHSKKPSLQKNNQVIELSPVGEDIDGNVDIDTGDEFPVQSNLFSAPETISSYTTKTNEKSYLFKRLMTEYSFQTHGEQPQTVRKLDFATFYRDNSKPPQTTGEVIGHVPCLILKSGVPTNKILMYFHGNGEDINLSYDLLAHIRNNLNIHVLGIEYPGYGLYKGEPSEDKILADAEAIFDYLTSDLGFDPQNIIVYGRSIGSGPATWLASKKDVGALALMSAFTSIRGVVKDIAGKWVQYLVKERFNNLENIAKVKCPTFIVHGLQDNFIPYKHSQALYDACKSLCELILPREMNHAEFDFYEDFTEPLADFLRRGNYSLDASDEEPIDFPLHLFGMPSKVLS